LAVRNAAVAADEGNHPYNFRSHNVFTRALCEADDLSVDALSPRRNRLVST
jgi:hypothetical protein